MPEKKGDYIHIPVPGEAGKHEGHDRRTKTLSKKKGIKALYCLPCKKLTTYMFNTKPPWNWTMSRAKDWVKGHKSTSFVDLTENGEVMFHSFNEYGTLVNEYGIDDIAEAVNSEKSDVDKLFAEERVIWLFGGIYECTAESIIKKLIYYDKLDTKAPIKMFMSSFGGSVYASFAIIDAMEYVQAPVETVGIGNIMSGGLLIFMAGDKRYISQSTSVLSHRFRVMKIGTQAELKADRKEDDLVHKRIVNHYVKFSNLETEGEVLSKLLQETNVWLTPEEAMSFGLADDYFDKDWEEEEGEGREEEGLEAFLGEAKKEIPLKDFEYLLHHTVIEKGGKEQIHHCYIYDHIANLFEHGHLLVKDGKAYLDGKVIKDELFHVIKGLESGQEAVWSDKEAKEGKIRPKQMRAGMTLKEKSKEW